MAPQNPKGLLKYLLCFFILFLLAGKDGSAESAEQPAPAAASTQTPPAVESSAVREKDSNAPDRNPVTLQPAAAENTAFSLEETAEKFQRGSWNILMGWTEIPAGIDKIGSQHGMGAAATVGVLHGVGRAVQRTSVGLFEIIGIPLGITDELGRLIEPTFNAKTKNPSEPAAPKPGADPSAVGASGDLKD